MENRNFKKIDFPTIEVTYMHTPLIELKEACPQFFLKLNKIQYDAKRCDLLERYFYFHHEYINLLNSVGDYCDNPVLHDELIGYARSKFDEEFKRINLRFRNSYGIHDLREYLRTKNCQFLSNPKLLGYIFLFCEKDELKKIIYHDILYSHYNHDQLNVIDSIIRASYNELLFRITEDKQIYQLLKNHDLFKSTLIQKVGFDLSELKLIAAKVKTKAEWKKRIERLIFDQKHTLKPGFTLRDLNNSITNDFSQINDKKSLIKKAIKCFVQLNFKNFSGSNFKKVDNVNLTLALGKYDFLLKDALIKQSKNIVCTNEDIAKILHNTFQIKSIKYYESL